MSLIGFSSKLVKPRLRVRVEFKVYDSLSDFWCQAFSERSQKTVENGMFHVFCNMTCGRKMTSIHSLLPVNGYAVGLIKALMGCSNWDLYT